jgi:putative FmdB family regulatory protein
MPIYEYGCPRCRKLLQFWVAASRRHERPTCPHCGRKDLDRVPSRFGVIRGGSKEEPAAPGPGADPAGGPGGDPFDKMSPAQRERAEREMMSLMEKAGSLDESDPRQLGAFMRRMTEVTGMDMEPGMGEAIRRLEAGEDPEKVEEQMGDVLGEGGSGGDAGYGSYSRDDAIYDL